MKQKILPWIGMLVGAFGSLAYADSEKVVNVNSVQANLVRTNAGWRAKESWITNLSKDEIKRMMGVQKAPEGQLDFESNNKIFAGPSVTDWRNNKGVNWLGPVMNQGNCGSCVAFATVATLEGQTTISSGLPWLKPTFSPQMLFACGGGSCESGWMPDSAANFLTKSGVVDEACMPYTSGSTGEDVSCSQQCVGASSRSSKIAGYSTPSYWIWGSIDSVIAALDKGPLVTTLTVYADFLTYANGVYKHTTGESLGGHAVSIAGYDRTKRAWLIRNSWGREWGDNGYAWISWDDTSGVGKMTWAFEVKSASNYLSVTSPSDKEYVSGVYDFVVQNKATLGGNVTIHLTDKNGIEIAKTACVLQSDKSCKANVDTNTLKEGYYQVFADGAGSPKSQVREFYVINSEPKMAITYSGDGVDLTKPLKDRPVFNVKVQQSPVPIQKLEFRVTDSSGKIVSTKGNETVLDDMKMGWRCNTVPNGNYTIQFHGETVYNGKSYAVDSASMNVKVQN